MEHHDQHLDEAEVHYAVVGNLIVLKIKPYQEEQFRYIVFNQKLQTALRIDSLEDSCVLLPNDHGLIFAKGYYLQSGEYKVFEHNLENMHFERRVASPNGEDFLNVFYNPNSGTYVLLSYNLIEQEVLNPIVCHGFSIFPNGELAFFRADEEQKKHHVVQIWQTPYLDHNLPETAENEGYLYKLGNRDIVNAMAECREVIKLASKEDSYANLYLDLVNLTGDVLDSFHWLNHEEAFELSLPLQALRETASSAVDEFDKVTSIKKNTAEEVTRVDQLLTQALRGVKSERADSIHYFVNHLSELRKVRGEVISLKELRYVDAEAVAGKEAAITEAIDELSKGCVTYLLKPEALDPYRNAIDGLKERIDALEKVVDANRLEEEITQTSTDLEMLIEIVSNLKIEDATHTTQIIDAISAIYSGFNRIIAALRQKRKELRTGESEAEFTAQIKLVEQGMLNYLDISETPEKCDEYLSKLMIQLEELEGKYVEFDTYLATIAEKREDLYNAFEAKKVSLVEQRNRRANALQQSAVRIIKGVQNRVSSLKTVSEINGYFAGDLMVDKVRDILKQLQELGDTVKVDELQSRLKTAQEEAIRQLKDKQELFTDGEDTISLGRHKFLVNSQALDLTVVPRNETLQFHLTGTNFYDAMTGDTVEATRPVWDQLYPSETNAVYRGEYLAYLIYQQSILPTMEDRTIAAPEALLQRSVDELAELAQEFMAPRFQEGYVKGVHNYDAARILQVLLTLHQSLGLLRYPPKVRVMARLFWDTYLEESSKERFTHRLSGMGALLKAFPHSKEFGKVIHDLEEQLLATLAENPLFEKDLAGQAAEYLFFQLVQDHPFVISHRASELRMAFDRFLKSRQHQSGFEGSLKDLADHPQDRFNLIVNWLRSFGVSLENPPSADYFLEAAALVFYQVNPAGSVVSTSPEHQVDELLGNHNRVVKGQLDFQFHEFLARLGQHTTVQVPRYNQFQEWKKTEISRYRNDLRLNEFKPRILSSFVRNKLISNVYLPIIGDNLAKQIGTSGEGKRTDLMGMLLLISPPGYGKTTLMEYVSNRLGLIFLKVNGPAIGHSVTSLDPVEAPNASAREELEKLNLGFEMGDNVMIYVDDIQHCHPEFLQKFISLCDAQRKIEGVFRGVSKTYDLRGRRVCVVMAGNPYTESGDKFQIPDMLANRADIYNLGDILGDTENEFKLSYLENSLTSNPSLARMAAKSQKDLHAFLAMAEEGTREGLDFEANHSPQEAAEYVAVLQKLLKVRDVILRVNMEYIRSAAQADEFRTEPPFKLQGSYRNMNKLAEQVVSIMNDEELDRMIMDYYQSESQTLTTGAEANLLKFKEMMGWQTEEEVDRWESIKTTFRENNRLRGMGSDQQFGQMLTTVESISKGLSGIQQALEAATQTPSPNTDE